MVEALKQLGKLGNKKKLKYCIPLSAHLSKMIENVERLNGMRYKKVSLYGSISACVAGARMGREGREGKGREGKGREGKGREGKREIWAAQNSQLPFPV